MDCSPPGSSVQGILQARILEWVSTPCSRRRQWQATPVLLPRKSHGQRSLVGCSPWGRKELDTTERLHFHFSLSYIEKEMATHSSVLAWRIPGKGEPGGLPSIGSHRVGHNWGQQQQPSSRGSFQPRDQTQVSYVSWIGRPVLYH